MPVLRITKEIFWFFKLGHSDLHEGPVHVLLILRGHSIVIKTADDVDSMLAVLQVAQTIDLSLVI